MKKIGLFCAVALLMVGLTNSSVCAEVQNLKVGGDVTIHGIYRSDFDLRKDSKVNPKTVEDDQSLFMSTVRVRLDADLIDNVAATIRFLNERDWDADTSSDTDKTASDDIDLDLAYITLKELNYSPLTLTLGRQELMYGNLLVIGDGDVNTANLAGLTVKSLSKRRAFDAIKGVFDLSPLTLDVFTAKINEDSSDGTSSDADLYGINARYQFATYDTIGEAYYFCKRRASNVKRVDTVGVRGSTVPIDNLKLNFELAHQFGEYSAGRDMSANALQLGIDYDMPDYEYSPTMGLWYTYLSGQKAGAIGTGKRREWDAMYGDQTPGRIASMLGFASSNVHIVNAKTSLKPTEKLGAYLDYFCFTAVKAYSGNSKTITGTDFTPRTYAIENDTTRIGSEIDLKLTYDYSEDIQFSLLGAYFIPGVIFADENSDTAKEILSSVSLVF